MVFMFRTMPLNSLFFSMDSSWLFFSAASRYIARYFGITTVPFFRLASVSCKSSLTSASALIPSSLISKKSPFFRRIYFFFLSYLESRYASSSEDISSECTFNSRRSLFKETPTDTLGALTTFILRNLSDV